MIYFRCASIRVSNYIEFSLARSGGGDDFRLVGAYRVRANPIWMNTISIVAMWVCVLHRFVRLAKRSLPWISQNIFGFYERARARCIVRWFEFERWKKRKRNKLEKHNKTNRIREIEPFVQPVSHLANEPLENGWKIANTFYRFSSISIWFSRLTGCDDISVDVYDYIKLLQPNWTRGREEAKWQKTYTFVVVAGGVCARRPTIICGHWNDRNLNMCISNWPANYTLNLWEIK